jgi:DNA-binding GntR family transcriptional regulator
MTKTPRATPRYQTLANDLLAKIESGAYAMGSQFPTEFEISAEYQVSRHTVRAALARLHSLGLIQRRPGAGTHVTAPVPPMRYQQEVSGIDDLLQFGRVTRLELQRSERMPSTLEVAQSLGVRTGAEIIRVFCLRFAIDMEEPICTTEILVRPARGVSAAALLNPETAVDSALKLLDFGRMGHVDQTFDAIGMPAEQASLLGVDSDSPTLRVVRSYHAVEGRIVCATFSLHPSGRFAYSMRLARRTAP